RAASVGFALFLHDALPICGFSAVATLPARVLVSVLFATRRSHHRHYQYTDVTRVQNFAHRSPPLISREKFWTRVHLYTGNDDGGDRKSTRLNSSHVKISYA